MPLQLDVGLTCLASTAGLPPISAPLQMKGESGSLEALSHLAGKLWCGKSQASSGDEGMHPQKPQDSLWQEFFADTTQWWDNRRSKPTSRHPDFKHKKSKAALWLDNRYKPAWVDSQLAWWDAGLNRSPESAEFAGNEGHLDVGRCWKLYEDGRTSDAVDALNVLVQQGFHVPNNLFYRLLKQCTADKHLVLGRRIHALTVESGYEGDAFLATHLIGLYASNGKLDEAIQVFSKVSTPSAYNWATIIFACARHGEAAQAIQLYRQMCESTFKPDNRIYVAILTACATAGDLAAGKHVHAHILSSPGKPDIFVQTGLLDMYAKCGSVVDARKVFDSIPDRNVVTWNAMLAGYAHQGMGQEALRLYSSMKQECRSPPSPVTFVCLLQACASVGVGALNEGKQLHAQIGDRGLQDDVLVGGSLVNMYSKCGSAVDARSVFERLPHKNVVTWNAMLAGYVQQGMGEEALNLYVSMQQDGLSRPSSVTFLCLLQACGTLGAKALHEGKLLHRQIEQQGLEDDVVLGSSLVNMYAKCGSLEDAHSVFDRLPDRNVVTWTTMIAAYAHQGMAQEALTLYDGMLQEGLSPPDSLTFVCLLQACAIVADLPLGKQLHANIEGKGMQADVLVGAALVNMYAKCGSMFDSQQVFDSLPQRTMEAWGALIDGYTRHGESNAVFDLLDRMRLEGVEPNAITFLSVLTVCSHVGLVDKGRKYFETMRIDYGISPTVEHYTCMMDLLARAGHLSEAIQMAKTMPCPPDGTVWLTLLGACQKWNNVEIGQKAFEFAVKLDGKDAAPYVVMSNIYVGAQMWEEAKEMQARRVKCGAWKKPGQSWWTDMDGVVHTFVVGDKQHAETEGIHAGLELVPRMKREGHVAYGDLSLRDIHHDEKQPELYGHTDNPVNRLSLA